MENNDTDEFFDPPAGSQPPAAPAPAGGGKKAVRITAAVLGALLLAVAAFLGGWYGQYYSLDGEVRNYLWAKSVLEKNYYSPLDEGELYQALYDSLAVDPYTRFYSASEYDAYMAKSAGENDGVGVAFFIGQKADERAQVFVAMENSPAERAGIRKGMYIFAFGKTADSLTEGNFAELRTFLSQEKGELVLRCGYAADGSDAANYTLTPKDYQTSFLHYRDSGAGFRFRGEGSTLSLTQTDEPMAGLDEKTAYIRLEEFSGSNTPVEFIQLLSKMKERGRTNLIFDLRSNGGGNLGILGDVASHLMRNAEGDNPVVLSAVTRSGQRTNYVCAHNDFSSYFGEDSEVYVLADEYTASASEALIGVLVDYGTLPYSHIFLREDEDGIAKTYGKGIMQTQFTSMNGSAMKLTTATIHWPAGKCIHGVGVTPSDGAIPIAAPFFWGADDPMLSEVLSRVCA